MSFPTSSEPRFVRPDGEFHTYFKALYTPHGRNELHVPLLHGPALLDSSRCSLQVLGTPFLQYPENPLYSLEGGASISDLGSVIAAHPVLNNSMDVLKESLLHQSVGQVPVKAPSQAEGRCSNLQVAQAEQHGDPEVHHREGHAQIAACSVVVSEDDDARACFSGQKSLGSPRMISGESLEFCEGLSPDFLSGIPAPTSSQQHGATNEAHASRIPSCRQSCTRSSPASSSLSTRSATSPMSALPKGVLLCFLRSAHLTVHCRFAS
jgi:hypothetical protein